MNEEARQRFREWASKELSVFLDPKGEIMDVASRAYQAGSDDMKEKAAQLVEEREHRSFLAAAIRALE